MLSRDVSSRQTMRLEDARCPLLEPIDRESCSRSSYDTTSKAYDAPLIGHIDRQLQSRQCKHWNRSNNSSPPSSLLIPRMMVEARKVCRSAAVLEHVPEPAPSLILQTPSV